MDGHSKRSRHNKLPKQSRRLHPIISGEIPRVYRHASDTLTNRSSGSADPDRLNDIIDDITSEGDEGRVGPSSKYSIKSPTSKLVEPESPTLNENRSSLYILPTSNDTYPDRTSSSSARSGRTKKNSAKENKKFNQLRERKSFSPSGTNVFEDRTDASNRRNSIGDIRRQQLTQFMEYYRHCLESAQNSNTVGMNDDPTNTEKRKQYTTALW